MFVSSIRGPAQKERSERAGTPGVRMLSSDIVRILCISLILWSLDTILPEKCAFYHYF